MNNKFFVLSVSVFFLIFFTQSSIASETKNTTQQAAPTELNGTVQEIIKVDAYLYLRLKSKSEEFWAAIPKSDAIKVGADVSVVQFIPMFGFQSKTLNRKFDKIYFGVLKDQLPGSGGGGAPESMVGHGNSQKSGKKSEFPDLNKMKVDKAKGSNAVTISELFARKVELNGKTILVRGKVARYNPNIMGKNWLHIQDGTGTEQKSDYDLSVTTMGNTKVGDTVLVSGKVMVDKRIDPYYFPILIEDAKLSKK